MKKVKCKNCGKQMYIKNRSTAEVCKECAGDALEEKGILEELACPICGKVFRQDTTWQKFCSEGCRQKAHYTQAAKTLKPCGNSGCNKMFKGDRRTKYCSRECALEAYYHPELRRK